MTALSLPLLWRMMRPDGLHTAFNFDFLTCPWDPQRMREVIDSTTESLRAVGAPPTWVLSNHDVPRHATRYGREAEWVPHDQRDYGAEPEPDEPDLERGTRRARAAALLMLALPGGAYVYQGEELGLPEVEDLPVESLQDPIWERSGNTERGRDGCRVPLPWSGAKPPFGFGPQGSTESWLPQPEAWRDRTAEVQDGEPSSTLELDRSALRLRRELDALGEGGLRWLDSPAGVLAFHREPGFACVVNMSGSPQPLPAHERILLASDEIEGDHLPDDTAVWLAD